MKLSPANACCAFFIAILPMTVLALLTFSAGETKKHRVDLSWQPASGHVIGYNIYRGTKKGGPYAKIASNIAKPPYRDMAVESHQTYYYVVTSVDDRGRESSYSAEIAAAVP